MKGQHIRNIWSLSRTIGEKIKRLETKSLLRNPALVEGRDGKHITISGRQFVSFASNDYLGLSQSGIDSAGIIESISQFGTGSSSSRLLQGNTQAHEELEKEFARFKGYKYCMLFNSALNANLGLIQSLSDEKTAFFSDEMNHASIIDGLRLAKSRGARIVIYKHCDAEELAFKLSKINTEKKIIITETLFSMDGDMAPLKEIEETAEKYDAMRIYDEAHSTGIYGKNGAGLLEENNINNDGLIIVSNMAKAGGILGGFITSNINIRPLLYSTARALIYTTSLPPFLCSTITQMVKIVEKASTQRRKLHENISSASKLFCRYLSSPILPFIIGDNNATLHIQKRLMDKGLFIPALRPPSVPEGTSRLRVSLTALHNQDDIEGLHQEITKLHG